MVVGNAPEAVDFLVIGAGPGGYTAALHAAQRGRNVVLVDRAGSDGIGGVCLNAGCIPSKTLIETADIFHRSQHSECMGVSTNNVSFNTAQFQQHKNAVIRKLSSGIESKLKNAPIDLIAGNAMFTQENTVVVATDGGQAKFLQFKDCVLATGSSAITLPGFEFNDYILDAERALQLQSVPESMAIIGAGYIGLELGCAFAKLGSRITVFEARDRLLPTMPAGPDTVLRTQMEALGVNFKLGYQVTAQQGNAILVNDSHNKPLLFEAEKVLVAVGRTPNTKGLELQDAGITTNQSQLIEVKPNRLATNHIAAIGDITEGPPLAHKAIAEAVVAVDALCGDNTAFEPQTIPQIIFTDPEIAIAGYNQSETAGIKTVTTKIPLSASGRALTMNATKGYCELTADTDGLLLGAIIVSPHASELIGEICVAIEMGAGIEDIALTIHAHPTLSEMWSDVAVSAAVSTV